mmetsp:Transcript_97066/g.118870  ORF Transcript_97066/g.118870 Transcript_97066/m.118870 type:complete len:253 (+) Transcript_97066:36-794(+)
MAEMTESTPLDPGPRELAGITETAVRNGFVRKVFSILMVQLLITTVIAGGIVKYGEKLMRTNPSTVAILLWVSVFGTVALMCVFACCPDVMRKSPTNYVLLLLYTLAESCLVGFIAVQYTAQSVLITFAITVVVVLALTIFACQTKYDFTGLLPYFFVASLCLLGLGIALSIAQSFGASSSGAFRPLFLVYAAGGALLFSGYIVLDTQLIVGGKHSKYRFTVDDYCFAAITIYVDIINLFLFLLQLFGERRR